MRRPLLMGLLVVGVALAFAVWAGTASAQTQLQAAVASHLKVRGMSQGAGEWVNPPSPSNATARVVSAAAAQVAFGSNVDAASPTEDLAGGQSETSIAASASGRVVVAWNDATGFLFVKSTSQRASLTGVGYSTDGGKTFTDLVGLRNPNPDQQWFGDPTVVSIDGGAQFIVGSLYLPSLTACADGKPAQLTVAVEVLTPTADGGMQFGKPIIASPAGNACTLLTRHPAPNVAFLDKDFLAWDGHTRTLALTFTRVFLVTPLHSGAGEIDVARAHVPTDATGLSSSDFRTIRVHAEEPSIENEGAYPAVAPNGNIYVAWERNWITNLQIPPYLNNIPYAFIKAALVPAHASGPTAQTTVSLGQVNSSPAGGVHSLDSVCIAGFNRCGAQFAFPNDFPRIAYNGFTRRVIVVWNDASLHPLGDIWLRSLNPDLTTGGRGIVQLNDDSDYTLHFLPALSVQSTGAICTSWYDRRLWGPDSARTDYFGECRGGGRLGTDFRITTGATDWANTSTLVIPNFGDYTDNTSVGTTTYYTWSDGRIGIPQPFADSR
jgi:hypothetical protein